ncbi:hypothetical protein BST81_20240 [Leptolyngbya sp. 'hensonii']|uniref:DUF565 domain-containing protein n=1 Tax=Leptolyngbya sp. 'hensonii' TaxID=1922337 RepID=UPI00094FC5E0|nr:DUF565 domain-containing protein [Leptolyngbya sp. 'hensonii']OLP16533.1 hypothetical protein BST81_20240 [Leptolyngbya sp. 'hensonii']
MQNTRLNNLMETITSRIEQILQNPWRRLAVLGLNLLFGFFLGSAIPTSTGQAARWDIVVALILVVGVEICNRIIYANLKEGRSPFLLTMLNSLKIGLTYGLFLEALKLAS